MSFNNTALITHPDCLEHVTPDGHPERVDRLRAVLSALEGPEFQDLIRIDAPLAEREALLRAHSADYLDSIEQAVPASGGVAVDADTWLSPGSWNAALRCAGAVVEAVDLALSDQVGAVFCAVRPPGHHAERERAMGFCLLSSAVIGALHAVDACGLSRVAVVDFDVHHGNGTQDVMESDGRIFYGSCHQYPLYPGTGGAHEVGVGNVVNLCLPPMSGSIEVREGFAETLLPALERFRPELLIISAGFDAHAADPLAQLLLDEDDFIWMTEKLCDVAMKHCQGRVVSTLEGGYDLGALGRSTAAHMRVLMSHALKRTA